MINLVFIFILSLFINPYFHPLHVSVTTVDYNETEDEFIISIKLFKDDFEKIVNHKYNADLDIMNCNFYNSDSLFIEKYINEHFSMKFDGKNVLRKQEYINSVCNEESIWVSFKIKSIEPKKKIEISNSLLTDLYDDQKNLLIFKYKKTDKGIQFNRKTTLVEFTL